MTDTDRYFAAWVELDRIHASDMTDAEKNAAIDAIIAKYNMDALWPNVDTERFHAMTQQYEMAKSIRKQSPEWFQPEVPNVYTSILLAETEHIREMNAQWERIKQSPTLPAT